MAHGFLIFGLEKNISCEKACTSRSTVKKLYRGKTNFNCVGGGGFYASHRGIFESIYLINENAIQFSIIKHHFHHHDSKLYILGDLALFPPNDSKLYIMTQNYIYLAKLNYKLMQLSTSRQVILNKQNNSLLVFTSNLSIYQTN